MMSRYVVARCSLWRRIGVISQLFSFTQTPLRQDRSYYRQSRYDKSPRKLHRRVVDESVMQQQLDIMKLSLADLESADSFGSLALDSDIDEDLKCLLESEKQMSTPARKRTKPASLETASTMDEHSQLHSSFSDTEIIADTHQEGIPKGPSHSPQQVSKHVNKQRISVPVEMPNETNEHLEIYNKFSGKKLLPHVRPGHKDWSEKFGSLSHDVDKFLDKYVVDSKRYS